MNSVDYIDKTEAELIMKFFSIDCYNIDKHKTKIMKLHREDSKKYRTIGCSNFKNVIDFYKFEFKPRELIFWELLEPIVTPLADINIPLTMAKVDLEYFWLDYVTDVNINFNVEHGILKVIIEESEDLHTAVLNLICNMMFVSDFTESHDKYKSVFTTHAWMHIYEEINKLKAKDG